MNIGITESDLARARDGRRPHGGRGSGSRRRSAGSTAIGIFPGSDSAKWAHLLRGTPVGEVSESIAIFRVESSTRSFRAKQVLRRREHEQRNQRAGHVSAAAE